MAPGTRPGAHRRPLAVRRGAGTGARLSASGVAVQARGWSWRHPGRRAWALRDVDLRVEPGERIVVVGPSGSGKSTLLLALAGLLDPEGGGEAAGELRVDGREPRAARDCSALVLQDPDAQIVMGRAGDDVAFGLENRCVPAEAIWPRVDAALDTVGMTGARIRSTHTLSGGDKQRLALAGVLAMAPGLVLLDEPTANLDPDTARAFRHLLRDALDRQGTTLVMVEHRLDEALDVAGRIVALDAGGRVIADGPADRILADRGDELAEAGVWVPGRPGPPAAPRRGPLTEPRSMLVAEQVSFTYPGAARPALPEVDARIGAGEALAVVGPNGAGKSTLAMLMGGLLRPTRGSVLAGDALAAGHAHEPIWRWPARLLAGRVGTVFQNPEHQFLAATCRDELLIGPRRAGLGEAAAHHTADRLLERLGLASLAPANPFTLSGGEQRRLSVATALASAPAVLVVDEPTFGQDRLTWMVLLELLAQLRDAGTALVVVSHDREFVRALADRVVRLPGP